MRHAPDWKPGRLVTARRVFARTGSLWLCMVSHAVKGLRARFRPRPAQGRPDRDLTLRGVRTLHMVGAWVFDHSGPLAPRLAALGEPLHRRLFPHSLLADPEMPIGIKGLSLYHDGRPSYHLQMLAMGMHDRDVVDVLVHIARPRMTVVDVGAHLGYFALLSAGLGGPGSKVWAFEPSPAVLPLLRRNVAANAAGAAVTVVPSAVGDRIGTLTLFPGDADSMVSSVYAAAAGSGRWGTVVPCTSLDAWLRWQGWPAVDVIKVDIEGHEVAALAGMRETIRRNPSVALVIELNERTLAAAGETISSFWSALAACGLNDVRLARRSLQQITYPRDLDLVRREIRRQGNDRVNLLCRRPAS